MLSLETTLQKIQQFTPEQRSQVIQFVEFLDFASSQATPALPEPSQSDLEGAFFELAGMWKNQDITVDSLRATAWREPQ